MCVASCCQWADEISTAKLAILVCVTSCCQWADEISTAKLAIFNTFFY